MPTAETADDRGGSRVPVTGANQSITYVNTGGVNNPGQKPQRSDQINNALRTDLRVKNPLSAFSSWNYMLTLYIVTPECANYFNATGTLPSNPANGTWYIVAQDGGINSLAEPRALTNDPQGALGIPNPGLDFYMDDLEIETVLLAQDGQRTATMSYDFKFKIIESTGFTFLTKLSRASTQINQQSRILSAGNANSNPNLYQQHYLVGIKFYGYDENGNLQTYNNAPGNNISSRDTNAAFERIFPILISSVNFKVDANGVTSYFCEASLYNLQVAFGIKRATILGNPELQGSTVGEILGNARTNSPNSLIGFLNSRQQQLTDSNYQTSATLYDIDWGDDPLSLKIKNSDLVVDKSVDPRQAPMGSATTTTEVTPRASENSEVVRTGNKITGIAPGTSIAKIIDNIIVKSKYIAGVLTDQNTNNVETKTKDNPQGTLKWFTIHPTVKVLDRDRLNNDWVYEITYQIRPYEIAHIRSTYVKDKSRYYGPVKKYSYYLTGENTEVVQFEITYNNLYYVIRTPSTGTNPNKANNSVAKTTPIATGGPNKDDATQGQLNAGSSIAETVRANLYSLADQAIASIRIMGDPDFLMTSVSSRLPESYNFGKFYGRDTSINPYGGQIFVEIIFKVAEDYKDNGLLDVDDTQTVVFYPPEIQSRIKNNGLIFKINKITSSFSRGKFEQTLDLYMVPVSELIIPSEPEPQRPGSGSTSSGGTRPAPNPVPGPAPVRPPSTETPRPPPFNIEDF